MIHGIGTDIVEINRIKLAGERNGGRFVSRFFTGAERQYCFDKKDPWPSLAARFAAKEAIVKALGTGFRNLKWTEVEVLTGELGEPKVVLSGQAKQVAEDMGVSEIKISLSHCQEMAMAFAVAVKSRE